jgi:hypothetical protein
MTDRKQHFLRVLDKILARVDYRITQESRYNLFITRSSYILEQLGRKRDLYAINNMVEVYDLKNDIFYEINLDEISSIEHIGLPFEVFPEYLYKDELKDKISKEDFFDYQKEAIEYVKNLGKSLSNNDFENNKLLVSSIDSISIIQNIENIVINNLDNILYTFDKEDLEKFKSLDISNLNPSLITLQEELLQKTFNMLKTEFPNIFEYVKYVRVCEFAQLPLKFLDSTDTNILEKVKNVWKALIEERSKKVLSEIACESEALDEMDRFYNNNKQDIEYVKELITNSLSEIDYSVFKSPRQLFHFWPNVLFPVPGFIVHDG